ncbi:MAG: ROK family protein [Acidimicrobiia bacterium]|nr:ROK family protein [Acidimicrobiia bacterium]MYC57459.1 ROK family protein [Acidimicrobiia bacterium]MYG93980.1 ROK family protein [Acidimicrobiia bacterium]MYI30053.1 ROK family protein [Acidimicrobiia bacterium]
MNRADGAVAAIGIDVGGTEKKAVLGNALGLIGEPLRQPITDGAETDRMVAETCEIIETLVGRANKAGISVCGIGLAIPGCVDPVTGRGEFSANLGWVDMSIGPELEAVSGLPVHVEHDIYAGALAEFTIGAGYGARSGAFVPLGTGVAAALFIDGCFWRGASRFVGEIGHISSHSDEVQCGCGRSGCAELFASARGLKRIYAQLAGSDSVVEAKEIAALASAGEQAAVAAWDTCVNNFAMMLAALTLTVDIDTVVVGGGLSESGAQLLDPLIVSVEEELAPLRAAPKIRRAVFGQMAGARGAVLHALVEELSVQPRKVVPKAATVSPSSVPAMFMLAFDHRSSTAVEVFGQEEVSPEQWSVLAEAKTVIAEAAGLARRDLIDVGEVSVLIDPEHGTAAACVAQSEGVPIALALEISGQRELRLLDQHTLDTAINTIGLPRWGKVLLRWNPGDPEELKGANLDALEYARRFCDTSGIDFLLELIVPATPADLATVGADRKRYRSDVLPALLPVAVGEITRRFGVPDLWKLEGVTSPVIAAAVAEAAGSGGVLPPILTLGAAADRTEIARWFAAGSRVPCYVGFAIGRSIWKAPIMDYLGGQLDRDATRDVILGLFRGFIDDYMVATRIAPAAGRR